MVLHKPYPVADESQVVAADRNRQGLPPFALADAAQAFLNMKEAAQKNGVGLIAFSGYRSTGRQKELFLDAQRRHGKRRAAAWVAPAGYSEHQTALAFDIGDVARPETDDEQTFETTPAFAWIRAHASEFGFEMSFPPDNLQGVSYEPWHWRFVGSPAARAIFHPGSFGRFLTILRAFAGVLRYQFF